MSDPQLTIWTIYDHPSDYPHGYVAREWRGTRPTENVIISDNLEKLRIMMSNMNLFCLGRDFKDDPKIVETWL